MKGGIISSFDHAHHNQVLQLQITFSPFYSYKARRLGQKLCAYQFS
jgi:hypothetical protein